MISFVSSGDDRVDDSENAGASGLMETRLGVLKEKTIMIRVSRSGKLDGVIRSKAAEVRKLKEC